MDRLAAIWNRLLWIGSWIRFLVSLGIACLILFWVPLKLAGLGWITGEKHGILDQLWLAGLAWGAWYLLLFVLTRPLWYSAWSTVFAALGMLRDYQQQLGRGPM